MATPDEWLRAISPPKERGPGGKTRASETDQNKVHKKEYTEPQGPDGHGITVLQVQSGHWACKTITTEGKKLGDYNLGYKFRFTRRSFTDWATLIPLLDELAMDSKQFLVLGEPTEGATVGAHRRLLYDDKADKASLRKGSTSLMVFDLDGAQVQGMDRLDPVAAPEVCVRAALDLLPEAFRFASVWYTFTSSQTLAPISGLRLRLVFLLSTPWHLLDMTRFARRLARDVPQIEVDAGIYSGNQPIYIARPVVEGGPDPLPRRSGFIQGLVDYVDMPVPVADAPAHWVGGNAGVGGVYLPEGHDPLQLIGDHDGGAGCYQGLRAATWHLVRLQGDTLSDADIKQLVRDRVAAAEWGGQHSPEYVANQVTDTKLDALVAGARSKQDAKQKLFHDVAPDYPSRPMHRDLAVGIQHDVTSSVINEAIADMTGTVTLLQGAAGLGKTTKTLAEAVEAGVSVHMFVPSYKLTDELVDMVSKMGATVEVMKGRTRDDGDLEFPRQMCDKADLAEALSKKGITNLQSLMCMRVVGERTVVCSSFGQCGYARQFKSQAQVKIYTHAHLALAPGIFERDVPAPQLTVVDEDPIKALLQEKSWALADARAAGGVAADIAEIVAAKLPLMHELRIRYDDPVEAVTEALDELDRVTLPVWPDDHQAIGLKRIEAMPAPVSFVALLEGVLEALRSGEDTFNGIWLGADSEKKEWLHLARLRTPVRLLRNAGKVLMLDATPNVDALRQALDLVPMEVHEINAERQSVVVQVYDTALSKTRLSTNTTLRQDLIGLVASSARQFGSVGVCGPKDVIVEMGATLASQVADGSVVLAHFGNLRGQDALKNTALGIVIGRQLPRAYDIERMARAIWPHEPLTLTGEYEQRPAGYRMRDGSLKGVMVFDHPDARVATVLRQICDAESSQALDRHRLVHRDAPKLILLLSNLPLDSDVDFLVELDDVLGRRGLASAVMQHGGVLPLGADWLEKNLATVGNRKSAEHWSSRVAKALAAEYSPNLYKAKKAMENMNEYHPNLYKGLADDLKAAEYPPSFYKGKRGMNTPQISILYMREMGVNQPQRLVGYRLAAQRRGQCRKAVTCLPGLMGVRSLLAQHHGVDAADVIGLQWADGKEHSTLLTEGMPVAPIMQKLLLPGFSLFTTRLQGESLLCCSISVSAQGVTK